MSLDENKLHIAYTNMLSDRFRDRISKVVDEVSKNDLLTIASLLGARFITTNNASDDWVIAIYNGRRVEFTERLSMHRCAAAFCIVANVFGDNP